MIEKGALFLCTIYSWLIGTKMLLEIKSVVSRTCSEDNLKLRKKMSVRFWLLVPGYGYKA